MRDHLTKEEIQATLASHKELKTNALVAALATAPVDDKRVQIIQDVAKELKLIEELGYLINIQFEE